MDIFYENLFSVQVQAIAIVGGILLVGVFSILWDYVPLLGKARYFFEENQLTLIALLASIFAIVLCSVAIFDWFPKRDGYEPIKNYVFITTMTFTISIIFSVFEWILSVADKNSFIINNQYSEHLHSKSQAKATRTKAEYVERNRSLDQFDIIFEKEISITGNSSLSFGHKLPETLTSIGVHDRDIVEIIKTSHEKLFFAIRKIIASRGRSISYRYQYMIIYCGQVYSLERTDDRPASKFVKLERDRQMEIIRVLVKKERVYLRGRIEFEDEIIEGKISIPFHDFIFNNMFELFSIRQGYFVPNSFLAKVVHFFFGVYKFLFLGALISLLLNK